jgi:hypothetical protein
MTIDLIKIFLSPLIIGIDPIDGFSAIDANLCLAVAAPSAIMLTPTTVGDRQEEIITRLVSTIAALQRKQGLVNLKCGVALELQRPAKNLRINKILSFTVIYSRHANLFWQDGLINKDQPVAS